MYTGRDVNENFYIKFFGFCFKKGMGVFCGKRSFCRVIVFWVYISFCGVIMFLLWGLYISFCGVIMF